MHLISSAHLGLHCFLRPVCLKTKDHNSKVPKFWDARNLCCNLPKIQTKRPNLRVFLPNGANGITSSEDPDQTVPLGAV